MSTHLQQLLRDLCWKTEWNYVVFWKLKDLDRMVLTWEDSYYNNQNKLEPLESKSFNETLDGLQEANFTHDFLGASVAKMSYHVYPLGEGIVGQVAITGMHQWILTDEHELCNGWEDQFAAGIKTVVVAAVNPHGVIQIGSINKVYENLQFLAHIRDAFSSFEESAYEIQTPMQYFFQSDISSRISSPDILQDYLLDKAANTGAVGLISKDGITQPTDLLNDPHCSSNSSIIRNRVPNDDRGICYSSQSCITETSTLYDGKLKQVEKNTEILLEFGCMETFSNLMPSFMFSAGTELHEALGPSFVNQSYPLPCDVEKPEIIENSMVTSEFGEDHLLEAVVENFCRRDALKKSKSFSTSGSVVTTERMPEPYINTSRTIGSSRYSTDCSSLIEESIRSSASACKEQFGVSVEPGKPNKKRARPGENSRPRPRDRQLIQDRIKELRELVPNGSKCSIDSLLERTIKHMGFMQNVTKHSDKLSECAKSKVCSEMGATGFGYEQGSSWAVEIGGHMKICPILVKNFNMNGQMLIEMLCDDYDHFLEITEAIKSLGLTILKGVTDRHEDKTWLRFVVEGESNRNLHRMDVLWSLLQILQSKTTA